MFQKNTQKGTSEEEIRSFITVKAWKQNWITRNQKTLKRQNRKFYKFKKPQGFLILHGSVILHTLLLQKAIRQ